MRVAGTRARGAPRTRRCPRALRGSASTPGRAPSRAARGPPRCRGETASRPSVVARRAVHEAVAAPDVVARGERVGAGRSRRRVAGGLPAEVEDLVLRAEVLLHVTVAVEAPLH